MTLEAPQRKRFILGVASALIGASMWGFSGSCVQFLTGHYGLDPAFLTMFRAIVGGILFLGALLIIHRQTVLRMLHSKRDLSLVCVFGFALFANLFTYAMTVQLTNAGNATVLQMMASVFVMVYMCLRTRTPPRIREIGALVLAIIATGLMATQGDISTLSMPLGGLVWGVLCAVAAAAYIILPKESGLAQEYGSVNVTGVGTCASAPFAIICAVALQASGSDVMATAANLDVLGWVIVFVGIILVGTIGAYGLYLLGVSIVGNIRGSLLGAMEPVSATAFSALWLGTVFTGFDVAGLVLMILMLVLITK